MILIFSFSIETGYILYLYKYNENLKVPYTDIKVIMLQIIFRITAYNRKEITFYVTKSCF